VRQGGDFDFHVRASPTSINSQILSTISRLFQWWSFPNFPHSRCSAIPEIISAIEHKDLGVFDGMGVAGEYLLW
jgi:hypothetical protein